MLRRLMAVELSPHASNTVRVLVADDHGVVRRGLRAILEAQPDWSIVAEVASGLEAIEAARAHAPDVVLMDVAMPGLNGIEATRRILLERPETRVIIITMLEADHIVERSLAAGAAGILQKKDASELLVAAINAVLAQRPYFSPSISRLLIDGFLRQTQVSAPSAGPRLSPRQREILQLIAEGRSTKEVAGLLEMSVKTAETHRTILMKKIGARSVAELVRYAIRNGVVEP
jgi:DNA-binding NarL/FixJ family response regulator